MSDCVAVMNRGRLEQVGTPEDIYLRPRTRFVAEFMGAMNWIDGIGVRPELTRLAREAPTNGARSRAGRIENAVFLGNCLHIETRLANGDIAIAEVRRADEAYRVGDDIHIWWNASDELALPPE